jgi:hypothetical protein
VLNFFKSLIPVWRFFESGDVVPQIWIQANSEGPFEKWLKPEPCWPHRLLFNPKINFMLYCYSLTHDVTYDLLADRPHSKSIEQLQSLLREQFASGRFKIVNLKDDREIFVSQDGFHV